MIISKLRGMVRSPARLAALIGLANLGFTSLLQLALVPLLINKLGDQGAGLWQIMFHAFTMAQLVEMGTNQGIIRFLGAKVGSPDRRRFEDSSRRLLWFVGMAFGLVFALVAGVLYMTVEMPEDLSRDF